MKTKSAATPTRKRSPKMRVSEGNIKKAAVVTFSYLYQTNNPPIY